MTITSRVLTQAGDEREEDMRVEIIAGGWKGSFFWAGSAAPERVVPDRTEDIAALRSVGYDRERLAGEEGGLPRRVGREKCVFPDQLYSLTFELYLKFIRVFRSRLTIEAICRIAFRF
jgi:hypothetical protein